MAKRRKRGDGGVSLRKDGRWEGRVVIGYDDKGLPVTKNVLAKTKSECIAKLKALMDSFKTPSPDQPKPGILLGAWLDLWYQSYKKPNLRPNTQMSYERRIYQHIIPALGTVQMDKLTTHDIQQFYSELKKNGRLLRAELYGEGLSDQTIRGIHTTLHAALDKAVAEKLILRNPADSCRLPAAKAREMQILTPEEIQRLLIQAKEDGCHELLLLELSTGLRRGEICALQWNDLNLRTGELRIERQVHRVKGELVVSPPKTKASNRSVILPAPVVDVLKSYKKTITSRWMFPSPVSEDSPRDPAALRKRLQIVLERAECKKIRFHDLRHVFCTTCLEHGMDVKTLSTVFGLGKNKKDGSRYIYFDYEPWPNAQGIKFHKAATYPEIKAWVLREYGLSVTDRHIAYVKRKHGIIMLVNQRGPLPENVNIPLEKETAIEAAFRHFGMI